MPSMRVLLASACLVTAPPIAASSATIDQQEFEAVLLVTPDVVRGEGLFSGCAMCHGGDGAGLTDGSVPAIAGQHFSVIVRQLLDYLHDRRWDPRMQHFADEHHLSGAEDFADVAAYISRLPRVPSTGHGPGNNLNHGAKVFSTLCAGCHGKGAAGAGEIPRLAGQHYEYLLRQMHDSLEGRRLNLSREHGLLLKRFQLAEFDGVSDYLSRLPP